MLEKILIISLIVWCVNTLYQDGMILGFVSRRTAHWPQWLQKPLVTCVICQTFWYGSLAYWLIYGNWWGEWLSVTVAAIGFNAIVVSFIPEIKD